MLTRDLPGTAGSPQAGVLFGPRYRLLEKLGKGGMGEVWKARDLELDQLVALKMIRPELLEDPDLVDRFKQEITLARKVTHRSVTRIYDLGEFEGTRFISMEYLEGVNLKEFIKQEGPLPEEKTLPIIRAVCEGLKAAHDVGVVHRDLKPQNILIDRDGHAHIMDFGIAFSGETAGLTRTGALIGTPEYMSPEQVRGERLDQRSDIYSLGLIFYEMATADLPFTADSVASSMYKRLSEKPKKPRELRKEIPLFLEKIILRCLEKERAFRYNDVSEILADIQQRHAPGVNVRAVAGLLRRRKVLLTGVAVVVVLGIALALLLRRDLLPAGPRGPTARVVTSVAVLPFQNTTLDPKVDWIRKGLATLLTTDLAQAKGIRVVSSARLDQTLNDLHLTDQREFDSATVQKVAGFLDAEMILTGSYASLGNTIRVDAQVYRLEGKEVSPMGTIKLTAEGEIGFLALVDDLARHAREKLGATPAQIQAERPRALKEVTTASVPAIREYTGALDLLHRGSYLEAVEGFKRAVGLDDAFAMAHARLGEAYRALGRDAEALQSLDLAVAHLEHVSEREVYVIKALQALLKNDTETAIQNYESLVQKYPIDPEAHFNLASVYDEKARNYDRATAHYQKAIDGDRKYAAAYYGLGRAQFQKGDTSGALKSFNAALAIQVELNNDEGKGTVLNGLGAVYYELGRDEEAARNYRESAEIKKKLGDHSGYARALSNLAQSFRRSGKFEEAIGAVQEALRIRRQIGDRRGECSNLESLGNIYYEAGRYQDSLKAHQESLRIARETGHAALIASNLSNIGAVYLAMGRYDEAEVFYQQALEKSREIGDKDGIARSLVDLGYFEFVGGLAERALGHYYEAMKVAREIEFADGIIAASVNLGALHLDQGRYEAALDALQDALRLLESSGDQRQTAIALKDLGELHARLGQFAEATPRLDEAEKIARGLGNEGLLGEILTSRGTLLLLQENTAEAGKAFRRAVDLLTRHGDAGAILRARIGLASQAALEGKGGGLTSLAEASRQADRLGHTLLIISAEAALARVALQAGKKDQALQAAEAVISRTAISGSAEPAFQARLVRGTARLGTGKKTEGAVDLLEALRILERIRGELDAAQASSLLARPDVKRAVVDLSRGLKEAGKAAEAERIAAWQR